MDIPDATGHTTHQWDPGNDDEVALARSAFDEATKRGYRAFRVEGKGRQGERLESFDPDAEKMLLVPQLKGG